MQNILRYFVITLLLVLFNTNLYAQAEQYAFRVSFTNKAATNYTIASPLSYLSQRALDRRTKYGIAVDSTDLPVVSTYIDSVLTVTNGVLHLSSRWLNHCVILTHDSSSVLSLSNIEFVNQVKKVGYYSNGLHQKPSNGSDSLGNIGNKPTAFDANFYSAAWNQINLCQGAYLHEQGNMGENKLIAVIDVGFSGTDNIAAFDSMFANGRLIDTWNFIFDTNHVYGYGDHGTQVLSCMAAYIPETFVGTAPNAMYALYATDHSSTEQAIEEDNLVAAAERADSLGTDVINSSLGYRVFDNPSDNYAFSEFDGNSTLVAKAANMATRKGILFVASAGNDGNNSWQKISTPADADSAMTIGSVTQTLAPSGFSSEGPNASGILKPNVSAMGSVANVIASNGNVIVQNGTSLSAPIIAGLAACLMQEVENLKPLEVRTLIESVSHLHSNPNNKSGHGVPNFKIAYDNITNVRDYTNNETQLIRFYPNPATNELYLMSLAKHSTNINYSIFDIQGKHITTGKVSFSNGITSEKITIGHLNAGIYILKISDGKSFQVGKLIKQ